MWIQSNIYETYASGNTALWRSSMFSFFLFSFSFFFGVLFMCERHVCTLVSFGFVSLKFFLMKRRGLHYGCHKFTMWNSGNSIVPSFNNINIPLNPLFYCASHDPQNKQIWLLYITPINQWKTNVWEWHLSYLSFSIFDLTSSSIDRISDATLPAGNY